jgi:hypothetical protein
MDPLPRENPDDCPLLQRRGAALIDSPQSPELRRIDPFDFERAQLHAAVNGVADGLGCDRRSAFHKAAADRLETAQKLGGIVSPP